MLFHADSTLLITQCQYFNCISFLAFSSSLLIHSLWGTILCFLVLLLSFGLFHLPSNASGTSGVHSAYLNLSAALENPSTATCCSWDQDDVLSAGLFLLAHPDRSPYILLAMMAFVWFFILRHATSHRRTSAFAVPATN